MLLYYLDSVKERATEAILAQLQVTLLQKKEKKQGNLTNLTPELAEEHETTVPVSYVVKSGHILVDIRDSADVWIRLHLHADEGVTIPPHLYHKVTSDSTDGPVSICILKGNETSSSTSSQLQRFSRKEDSISINPYHTVRELVCELCRQFFEAGWVTGTGGSISIRHGNRIYMTPSGVQKERILPDELYVVDIEGAVLCAPEQKPGCRLPKLSDCSPLFLHAFKQRNAGAVLHSHSICCNLVTSLFEGKSEFRISHQEMIKGINGYGYFDELAIPIIENTAWEHELADSLGEAIAKNPRACAILVRRHGMYVWGDTWEQAKRHGECLHYLFEVAIQMRQLGMDFNAPPKALEQGSIADVVGKKRNGEQNDHVQKSKKRLAGSPEATKVVLFDIEGTTTPISFVKDVLFPYAAANMRSYLESTWSTERTQQELKAIKEQADADKQAPPVPDTSDKATLLPAVVENLQWNISQDRKIAALKDIQGHLWEEGYKSGALHSLVYDDVPKFFEHATEAKVRIAIYSSGSREAQRALFKYTEHGDLRPFISCYFDTSVGNKRSANSYKDIIKSLGVDTPSEVLFVTDILEEAIAAQEAGMKAAVACRPGNAALPRDHQFRVVSSFDSLLL